MTLLHAIQATAVGGRDGWAGSADGALKVEFSPRGAQPEHLLAAACAVSFLEALRTAATETGATLASDANVTATVGLRSTGEDAPKLEVSLAPDLPGLDPDAVQALTRRALALCPLARALSPPPTMRLWTA